MTFRSGFVSLVGRPNVGKSTLLNRILGQKVTIVSDKPQTTRTQVRGVLNRPDAQLVFVDTPGMHKPRSALGVRLNDTATQASSSVDVVCLLIDGASGFGTGDQFLLQQLPANAIIVINKTDAMAAEKVVEQLVAVSTSDRGGEKDLHEYFPVSAMTGDGVDALVDHLVGLMPEGPQLYPDDVVTDMPDAFWVAELVREQLLAVAREELPHSIAAQVTEWDWPRIRVEILVERESQKGIVIGKKGSVLKEVGTRVREQLPEGAFVELFVKVDKNWQRRPKALERLGY